MEATSVTLTNESQGESKRETREVEEDDTPNGNINSLDDDCMIEIFKYLSIRERLGIARVCKRWEAVILQPWSNITSLTLNKSTLALESYKRLHCMTNRALENLLSFCGRFLNTLEIDGYALSSTRSVISYVNQYCFNLERLTLYMEECCNEDLFQLFFNLKRLSNIKIYGPHRIYFKDGGSTSYVKMMTKLNGDVENADDTSATFATAVENLRLFDAPHTPELNKLWELEVNGLSLEENDMEAITGNRYITHLTLSKCSLPNWGHDIGNLSGLKYLNVAYVIDIGDSFLQELSRKCRELQYLDISKCRSITSAGIDTLGKLEGLEILRMSGTCGINRVTYGQFRALKVLDLEEVYVYIDDGLESLIRNAPHLEELNLYRTSTFMSPLEPAYHVIINRINSVSLRIFVNSMRGRRWAERLDISPTVMVVDTSNRYFVFNLQNELYRDMPCVCCNDDYSSQFDDDDY